MKNLGFDFVSINTKIYFKRIHLTILWKWRLLLSGWDADLQRLSAWYFFNAVWSLTYFWLKTVLKILISLKFLIHPFFLLCIVALSPGKGISVCGWQLSQVFRRHWCLTQGFEPLTVQEGKCRRYINVEDKKKKGYFKISIPIIYKSYLRSQFSSVPKTLLWVKKQR